MTKLLDNKILAPRFNQRSIEFYNAAGRLRENFVCAVHVIDYCTALSFELKLKAILAWRDEFGKKFLHHNINKLFEDCKIENVNSQHKELIDYYDVILNVTGRYSISRYGDREMLNSKISGMCIRSDDDSACKSEKKFQELNYESGIVNDCYKEIWGNLCEIVNTKR